MHIDAIDTNILVHGILGDDPSCRANIWHFLNDSQSTHRVFDMVISEAIYVFDTFYKQTRTEIANNLTLFFNQFDDKLSFNSTVIKMVLPFWVEHPSLSFNDCYLGFMAGIHEVEPLYTLDKKLAAQHPSVKLISNRQK